MAKKEKKVKVKKEKSNLRLWIENIVQVLVVVGCIVFSILMIASPGGVQEDYSKINVSYMPVLSESMSGTFEKGDLIFGEKTRRENGVVVEILDVGEVAIFIVNDPKISEYQYINTHRIVGYTYLYDKNGTTYAGYKTLLDSGVVKNKESAYEYAESLGWDNFEIIGYITSGDNKSIYYVDGNINGELIKESNTDLIDDYQPSVQQVIGKWNGKKLSGVGGVITWIQDPTHFFIVILVPLILLFGYNVWIVIQYVIEVKTEKAKKLALEEAKAGGISLEEEEEIKRKAVEEYMKKMGIDPNSLPKQNDENKE
ncbi:MAG: S26 family signal peptidase [Erysipelotrichaceae bacterium]|nr:S26 family signal peptidase [Erysipelotrichaceae bacterium]